MSQRRARALRKGQPKKVVGKQPEIKPGQHLRQVGRKLLHLNQKTDRQYAKAAGEFKRDDK